MQISETDYFTDKSIAYYINQIQAGNIHQITAEVDPVIVEVFWDTVHKRFNIHLFRKDFLDNNPLFNLYLVTRFPDSSGKNETVFRIMHNIEDRPVCKTCGGKISPVKFEKYRFNTYCCKRCVQSDPDIIKKKEQTTMEHFGVKYGTQSKEVQQKRRSTCIKRYGADNPMRSEEFKAKMTDRHVKKYGVQYTFQREEVKEKTRQTWQKKYGVKYAVQAQCVKDKAVLTCLSHFGVKYPMQSEEVRKKSVETCMQKYGVSTASQYQEIKDKMKDTCMQKYGHISYLQSDAYNEHMVDVLDNLYKERGVHNFSQLPETSEKRNKTMMERYGVLSIILLPERAQAMKDKISLSRKNKTYEEREKILEKYQQTCLSKYGYKYVQQTLQFRQHISEIYKLKTKEELAAIYEKRKQTSLKRWGYESPTQHPDIIAKIFQTRKEHGKMSSSEPEKYLNKVLSEKYEVLTQYRSAFYPFHADFYLPELDLYIEYQGNWTHGAHRFDINSDADIELLNIYKKRAESSKYYSMTVYIWTEKDPIKRNTATQNNLRYLEIFPGFPLDEIPAFIEKEFSDLSIVKQLTIGEK